MSECNTNRIDPRRFLKPLKTAGRKRRKIAGDLETRGLFGDYTLGATFDGHTLLYFKTVESLVHEMLRMKNAGSVHLFHNGFNYDIKYLIPEFIKFIGKSGSITPLVAMGNRTISFDIRLGKRIWHIWDTTNIALMSLDKLTEMFAPEFRKKAFDHNTTTFDKDNPEHREYLEFDVKGLWHAIENLEELLHEHFGVNLSATSSSTANRAFRRHMDKAYLRLGEKANEFIRKAIHGGYVYLSDINMHFDQLHIDVNAMYGAQMRGLFPVGSPTFTDVYRPEYLGYYRCMVYCPACVKRPFIPDDIGHTPHGNFETTLFTDFIEDGRKYGYEIIPLCGYYFKHSEQVFKSFIDKCEALELPNKGNAIGALAKDMRNRVFGQTIMHQDRMEYCISSDCPGEGWFPLVDEDSEEFKFVDYFWCKKVHVDTQNMMPHWGAAILARARIEMHRIAEVTNSHYGDTDSAVADRQDILAAFERGDIILGKNYGEVKIEGDVTRFRAFGLKIYWEELADGTIKKRHKGIRHSSVDDVTMTKLALGELDEYVVHYLQSNSLISMLKNSNPMAQEAQRILRGSLHSDRLWCDENGNVHNKEVRL